MNKKREAKLYMFDTVITGCDADNTIPPLVPAFDATLTIFKTKVTAIHTTAIELDKDITGNAVDKANAKLNAAKPCSRKCSMLASG